MPTVPCNDNKTAAQTLFLGASVSSFNTSMGWGSQPSQCTVSLIEDDNHTECHIGAPTSPLGNEQSQFSSATTFNINHYHDCIGDACYVNAIDGIKFNPAIHQIENKMLPGKVYYEFFTSQYKDAIGSKYWYNPDPGFFGLPTRIKKDGTYYNGPAYNVTTQNRGYDIIDTPVYFKMGDFSFGGLVQSWSKNLSSTGRSYTVTINSMQSLLSSCFIILDKFAGAIFSKSLAGGTLYGSPRNYTKTNQVIYGGSIAEGNLPNVFNVYGFLESLGIDGFGGSRKNNDGISANKIVDAITVLTSSQNDIGGQGVLLKNPGLQDSLSDPANDYAPKAAFSPFGRILAKCIQEQDTYDPVSSIRTFGVIPPSPVINAMLTSDRCQFSLDLSELPRTSDDFRLPGPVISILDLITTITDQTGHDFYIDMIPIQLNGKIHNIIKVKTISRLKQPRTNLLENTIKTFECNQYPISATTIGKEKNETSARSVIIGGPQQRLYQTKAYRLAYTQANYIFNPTTYRFIDYMQLGSFTTDRIRVPNVKKQFHHGKIKFPNFLSTRNPEINAKINPSYSDVLDDDDVLQNILEGANFKTNDIIWNDQHQLGGSNTSKFTGNYHKSTIVKQEDPDLSTWGITTGQRFFPLYKDVISPFFGFVSQEDLTISTKDNNSIRRIRPVWFDTWTGQSCAVIITSELPLLSVPITDKVILTTLDGTQSYPPYKDYNVTNKDIYFCIITESEIRAALEGFDSFLVYSLSKTYKPDLIEMLRRAHIKKDALQMMQSSRGLVSLDIAEREAAVEHDWYWRLQQPNIAGYVAQPSTLAPDKSDGAGHLPERVLNDIKALHKFVESMGSYYGKKYMVSAQNLRSYRDEKYADLVLPTQNGNAYIFSGGGDLVYNYQPTNDGAWEEYGNIIDDTIAVGSSQWYALTDDAGKIKPILGYNASDYFDYIRSNACKNQKNIQKALSDKANPFWSYDLWKYIKDTELVVCNDNNFIFPSLDISSLSNTDYIITDVIGTIAPPELSNIVDNSYLAIAKITNRDAWGKDIGLNRKKLYVTTTIDEDIVYLEPEKLRYPKILINAPGIHLTSSSSQFAKDPNRTIIANCSVEDLAIYLKITPVNNYDYGWIRYMLTYIAPVVGDDGYIMGNYAISSNQSANHITLSPKVAHPFFAGIPIRSNTLTYGPWTNYPYLEHLADPTRIFPDGTTVSQSKTIPAACTEEPLITTNEMAKKAIDNWIVPTLVEYKEDFVPWNYGGCSFLDQIAINEIETKINYQNILETAQIDMVGLPMFDLGGAFSFGNINKKIDASSVVVTEYTYFDTKLEPAPLSSLENTPFSTWVNTNPTDIIVPLIYNTINLNTKNIFIAGPIITNIQVSVSQQGLSTTYSFRTYTRKLGLFNKEYSDRVKFSFNQNIARNKQIADLKQQNINLFNSQNKFLQDQKLNVSQFGTSDLNSKLYGWSPSLVLIGQASPFLMEPDRNPPYTEDSSIASNAGTIKTKAGPVKYSTSQSFDIGDSSTIDLSLPNPYVTLSNMSRYKTTVGLFERKEVDAQLNKDYGLQSAMSLDGLLSPVSFYPTLKNSTYHFSLYYVDNCPFCSGTKMRDMEFVSYEEGIKQDPERHQIYCDRCANPIQKLNSKLSEPLAQQANQRLPPFILGPPGGGLLNLQGVVQQNDIPINLITLNPIVVPYGEFKNSNVQQYLFSEIGPAPGFHQRLDMLRNAFGFPYGLINRPDFMDRQRHSVEIVARGSVIQTEDKKSLEISRNLRKLTNNHNADFNNKDIILLNKVLTRDPLSFASFLPGRGVPPPVLQQPNIGVKNIPEVLMQFGPESNQRFMGLRGPLLLHSWGYDTEGYPVPNAADEPLAIDEYNQPYRFMIRTATERNPVTFDSLNIGDKFTYGLQRPDPQNMFAPPVIVMVTGVKTFNNQHADGNVNIIFSGKGDVYFGRKIESNKEHKETTTLMGGEPVYKIIMYEDNLNDEHIGTGPAFQGSIVSKTQRFVPNDPNDPFLGGQWTDKKRMREFYLNWAERPDVWPVGPIDLRWDDSRHVWTIPCPLTTFQEVLVTLQEDLTKEDDFEETFAAVGFLDDIDYAKSPLPEGAQRLVYVKDRTGYTAPRGVKLLCRYDSNSGFYEPISKPSIMANGILGSANSATIEMTYIQGRQKGAIPTMNITFNNKFKFNLQNNAPCLFTYISGEWILVTVGNV